MKNRLFWLIGLATLIAIGAGAVFLMNSGSRPAVKEFKINAFKYYFDPDIITVKKGDKVKITVNNTDVIHGLRIPELGISGNETVEFTAGQSGEFAWYCNNYCGDGHGRMQGKLIIQ